MTEPAIDDGALKNEGDRFLIQSIRQGDTSAFAQLVDRFNGRLRAYAARRLSGSGIDPEDAVQEAFLGFLQSIEGAGKVRSLQAYLFQILRNKVVDLTRKRPEAHGMRQIPLVSKDSNAELHGYEPVAPGETPSGYARRNESIQVRGIVLSDILDEAINELREQRNFRDLKALELLFYSSWKNRDIAPAVGVSEPTVTRIKAAALEKLARLARRHALTDNTTDLLATEDDQTQLIRSCWKENLLSCLKRSTLGAYTLGALEEEWVDYVTFHLETVGCEYCEANLADLKGDEDAIPPETRKRIFESSVGFLRKMQKKN